MPEKAPEREKEEEEHPKKRRGRKKPLVSNVEPAEEPVRGPTGEEIYE